MKANVIFLLMLSAVCLSAYAQDDDMYSFSSKKKGQQTTTAPVQRNNSSAYEDYGDANVDYHTGQLRDVDEYNRRYSTQQAETPSYEFRGDTLLVTTQPAQDDYMSSDAGYDAGYHDGLYDGDFYYTSRLARYRGFRFYDPFVWDITYGWYDPWYDPWYGWDFPLLSLRLRQLVQLGLGLAQLRRMVRRMASSSPLRRRTLLRRIRNTQSQHHQHQLRTTLHIQRSIHRRRQTTRQPYGLHTGWDSNLFAQRHQKQWRKGTDRKLTQRIPNADTKQHRLYTKQQRLYTKQQHIYTKQQHIYTKQQHLQQRLKQKQQHL